MRVKLERPICFFDLETTGAKVGKDRIVEIAILKVNTDTVSYTHLTLPTI